GHHVTHKGGRRQPVRTLRWWRGSGPIYREQPLGLYVQMESRRTGDTAKQDSRSPYRWRKPSGWREGWNSPLSSGSTQKPFGWSLSLRRKHERDFRVVQGSGRLDAAAKGSTPQSCYVRH